MVVPLVWHKFGFNFMFVQYIISYYVLAVFAKLQGDSHYPALQQAYRAATHGWRTSTLRVAHVSDSYPCRVSVVPTSTVWWPC